MTSINALTLEVPDVPAAEAFYASAFGLGAELQFTKTDAATSGFRGYTISLLVSQPGNATALIDSAITAGASVIKAATKSMWGFGGTIQAPDGVIWKIATSAKKDVAPASREIEEMVVLIAAADVSASKKFYVDKGLVVDKSFGKYVQFKKSGTVGFGLYSPSALAKDAGVPAEGSGSHRLVIISDAGAFTDRDRFVWA